MNECRAIALFIDFLQIDDQGGRVMFRVREDFCAKEGDDVIRYNFTRLVLKICIIDS